MRAPGRRRKASGNNAAALPQNPYEGRRAYCKIGTEDGGYAAGFLGNAKTGVCHGCAACFLLVFIAPVSRAGLWVSVYKALCRSRLLEASVPLALDFFSTGELLRLFVGGDWGAGRLSCRQLARRPLARPFFCRSVLLRRGSLRRSVPGRTCFRLLCRNLGRRGRNSAACLGRFRGPRGGGLFWLETCSSKLGGAPAFLHLFLWQESHCGCSPATSFAA